MTAKSYVKIVIVGFALCLAMVLCASFAKYRSEQSFIDGAENGFGIDGMYVNDGATRTSMAILAGEDMEWQICNDDGSCLSGRLAATSDPNSFDLLDNDGADCGSVHLSYASRDGMDGILYVSHETDDFKMRRTNQRRLLSRSESSRRPADQAAGVSNPAFIRTHTDECGKQPWYSYRNRIREVVVLDTWDPESGRYLFDGLTQSTY